MEQRERGIERETHRDMEMERLCKKERERDRVGGEREKEMEIDGMGDRSSGMGREGDR